MYTKAEFDEATGQWVEATGRPDARVAEWDGSKWTEVGRNPSGPGAISRGLTSGIEGTKGLLFDVAPAMVQQALGYEEASKRNLEAYRKRMQQLQESGKGSRVGLEDVKDLSSFLSFAGEAFGEAIPSMATALAGGAGAAAGAARLGAGRLLSGQVAKRAAELEGKTLAGEVLSKEAALALATKEASQKVGQVAGALGGSALLNIPESYASLEEAGVDNLGVAFGVGALKSTLDALGPIRMLSKTRGPDFSDKLTDLISARLLKGRPGTAGFIGGTLETTALEGLTEGAQELLDQTATAILADKSIDWKQVLEAAAKGGIGAAPIGGAAGAYGARSKAAAAAEAQTATEEKTAAQEAEKQRRTQETEAALSFPEDYAIRREFGEIKDSAGYSQLADFFASKAKAKGTSQESRDRYWEQAKRYNELARTADTENLVARLAKYYNFNEEQEAALLRYASDFGGPGRVEFEKFVSDVLQDPAAVGAIPGLQTVEFLSVKPEKTAQLALPAPSEFGYDLGEFSPEERLRLGNPTAGILTPKQADAYINSFISRPVVEGADTRDRVNKLEQLQQLDPKINPKAGTIDPNERRRLALNIITGRDIQQIQQPTETRLPSGETVETKEPLERVTPAGQVGTREGTLTYENLYQRIVDNLPVAEGTLSLKWLQEAAGVITDPNKPGFNSPQNQAAAAAVTANRKYLWQQLVADQYVTPKGKVKDKSGDVVPIGYVVNKTRTEKQEANQFQKNVDTLANALTVTPLEGESSGPGFLPSGSVRGGPPTGRLGIEWLTSTLGRPSEGTGKITPEEAKKLWAALVQKNLVRQDRGMYVPLRQEPSSQAPASSPTIPPQVSGAAPVAKPTPAPATQAAPTPEEKLKPGASATAIDGTTGVIRKIENGEVILDVGGGRTLTYPLEAFEEPTRSASKVENLSFNIDPEIIRRKFASSVYATDPGNLAVKELGQNSFDAIKEALATGQITDGKIDITLDSNENSITVSDNGVGMDLETLKSAVFTVGGTKKNLPPEMRSGGLGNAKIALFTLADTLEITTIKDGTKISVKVSGDEVFDSLVNPAKPTFPATITNTTEDNGTTVKILFKNEYPDPKTGALEPFTVESRFADYKLYRDPPLLDANLRVTFAEANDRKRGIATPLPTLRDKLSTGELKPVTSLEFDWGTAELYSYHEFLKDEYDIKEYPSLEVFSSGLHQFYTVSIFRPLNDDAKKGYSYYLNIKPKVEASNPFYPFNDTREDFKSSVVGDVEVIPKLVGAINLDRARKAYQGEMTNVKTLPIVDPLKPTYQQNVTPTTLTLPATSKQGGIPARIKIENGRMLDPTTGRPIVIDSTQTLDITPITNLPAGTPLYINNLNVDIETMGGNVGNPTHFFAELSAVFNQVMQEAVKVMPSLQKNIQDYRVGVGLDKTYHGLNTTKPYKSMLVNPLALRKNATIPGAASKAYLTMVHELSHVAEMNHNEDFSIVRENLEFELNDSGASDAALTALRKIYTKHFKLLNHLKDIFNDPNTSNRKNSTTASPSRVKPSIEKAYSAGVSGYPGGAGQRGQYARGGEGSPKPLSTGPEKQESGRLQEIRRITGGLELPVETPERMKSSIEKENVVKGIIDAVSQTSRRGFLRGVGSAAMSAGLPGTQAIKQATDATRKIQDLNTTIRKLDDIFRSGDMGGLWKIPKHLEEANETIHGKAEMEFPRRKIEDTWAFNTLFNQKQLNQWVKEFQKTHDTFRNFHPAVQGIEEVQNTLASLYESTDKLRAAADQYGEDLNEKADDLNIQFLPTLELGETPLGKKLSGFFVGTLNILSDPLNLGKSGRYQLPSAVVLSGNLNKYSGDFSDTFLNLVSDEGVLLAKNAARGLETQYNWKAVTPEIILNRVQEILPTIKDSQLRGEAARFVREATELQNLTAEDMQELESTISKINQEYVKALPKVMGALQNFARLHKFTTKVMPKALTDLNKAQEIFNKYEARDALEKRKDARKKAEEAGDYTRPKLTQLVNSVFREISLPRGTPAQMQKQVDQMFDRMQRLQKAADDAIPDDYSCG